MDKRIYSLVLLFAFIFSTVLMPYQAYAAELKILNSEYKK